MNTNNTSKFGLTILIVIILALGLAVYSYNSPRVDNTIGTNSASSTDANNTNNTSTATDGADSEWFPSASFACKDKTHFIAEFSNANEVKIIVDGNITQSVPHVDGDGQRFENNAYIYVFAGEEVSVTNKSTKKTTTCEQPRDPNNAPINFGDAGEGGAGFSATGSVKQDISLIIKESIVGKWKSTSDGKFVREFATGGIVTDFYDGKTVTTGKWQVFTSEKPLSVSFPIEKNATYIQITVSGTSDTKGDALNFKLAKLTPESLELIYMERGGINTFTRVR